MAAILEPGLLAKLVNYNPHCNLQENAIFTALIAGTRLRRVIFSFTCLSWVKPGLLARALVSLEEVGLGSCQMTSQQVSAILTAIQEDTRLRKLDLSNNIVELIQPGLLARAVNLLEVVDISNVRTSQSQIRALFTSIAGATKLKTLKIGNHDWVFAGLLSLLVPTGNFAQNLAQVSKTLEDVKRDSILEIVSPLSLGKAFDIGIFQISIEADRFKMNKIDEMDKE